MHRRLALFTACLFAATQIGSAALADRVTVFAAASLKNALDAVIAAQQIEITAVYAGSATLARQIAAGAPADVFISANPDWMDWLETQGALQGGTRLDVLTNRLAVIRTGAGEKAGALPDIATLLNGERLATAFVDAVPAGIYARAALQSSGQWERVAPLLAETDNVRAALALVARGEAPLGIVYATDAMAEPRVSVLYTFAPADHPPIVYPAALIQDADNVAQAFLDHLTSPAAQAIFSAQGFGAVR